MNVAEHLPLGAPVRIDGQLLSRNLPPEECDEPGTVARIGYDPAPSPTRVAWAKDDAGAWQRRGIPFTVGVVAGQRTIQDRAIVERTAGGTLWDPPETRRAARPVPGTARLGILVVTNLRRRPILARPDQLQPTDDSPAPSARSRFQLAERVEFDAALERCRSSDATTHATIDIPSRTGLIIGARAVPDYDVARWTEDDGWGDSFLSEARPRQATTRRAWLIVTEPRRRPTLAPDDRVQAVTG